LKVLVIFISTPKQDVPQEFIPCRR